MKTIIYILSLVSLFFLGFDRKTKNPKAEDPIRNQLQQIYTAELGIREKTGRNDGPRVETYLRHVNLKRGDPWCAAFVCWVFDRAGVKNPRTGWSPGLFPAKRLIWRREFAVAVGRRELAEGELAVGRRELAEGELAVGSNELAVRQLSVGREENSLPQKGDVFGIWFPDKQRIAHVGFVDRWDESWLITVEGNTNEAGSREGDGVWRKRRLVRTVSRVADWVRKEGISKLR